MTQAYLEGFCKTAADHGLDPNELLKIAYPTAYMGANDTSNVVSLINQGLAEVTDRLEDQGNYFNGVASQLGKGVFKGFDADKLKALYMNKGNAAGRVLGHLRNGIVGYNNMVAGNAPTLTNSLQKAYSQIAGKQKLDPNGPIGKLLGLLKRPVNPAK